MTIPVGNKNKVNRMKGTACVIYDTDTEIANRNQPVGAGALIYNQTTRELKVSDGLTAPSALPDHAHKAYAPVEHSHIYSANQPWFMANARLWYRDDLVNHPELIPLEGDEISNDLAEYLSTVFPGTKLLTNPVTTFTTQGFENDEMYLQVSNFVSDWAGSKLVGGGITFSSVLNIFDQWLTSSTDVNQSQYVTVTFKGNHTYRPTNYWIVPAAGAADAESGDTAPYKRRPTPRDWVFEGSNDDGGTWEIIDQHADVDDDEWELYDIKEFTCDTDNAYAKLRLRITKWNASTDTLTTGLKRFWVFGRKTGVFCLPDIPSPSDEFVWVVPIKNKDVGLVHEEIGDLGRTSLLPQNLPFYRIPTDGRAVAKTAYPLLFSSIGYSCDTRAKVTSMTVSDGSVLNGEWNSEFEDTTSAGYVEFTIAEGRTLGGYIIDCSNIYSTPAQIVVEGKNSNGTYDVLQSIPNIEASAYTDGKLQIFIDTSVTDEHYVAYRINVINWHNEHTSFGFKELTILTHPLNQFYVPTIVDDSADGVYNYIVADNTVADVTPNVIQRLQKNIADLSATFVTDQTAPKVAYDGDVYGEDPSEDVIVEEES